MDIRVLNMSCTSLSTMAEVTDKLFTPAAAETVPLPLMLAFFNVMNHLALRGTLKYFIREHVRLAEGFVTHEVTANIETMANIASRMKNKKSATGTIFVSPPGYMYLPDQYNSSCT